MKKIITIFLCFIVMMNAGGYYALFLGFSIKINSDLDYSITQGKIVNFKKITFKKRIVSLPYLTTKAIENDLAGELIYRGKTYRYVKTILKNNTLYYQCVLNQKALSVNKALDNYFKYNAGKATNSNKNTLIGQKIFKDYLNNANIMLPAICCFCINRIKYSFLTIGLVNFVLQITAPPPKFFL